MIKGKAKTLQTALKIEEKENPSTFIFKTSYKPCSKKNKKNKKKKVKLPIDFAKKSM